MEQNNQTFEFRAMTIKSTIIAMIIWLVISILLTDPIWHFFNFYSIKRPSISDMTLVCGTHFIISFSILLIISQYLISSKYMVDFDKKTLKIYKNKLLINTIHIENIKYITLKISDNSTASALKSSALIINYDKKELTLFNGFFFTFSKETKILENLIKERLNPFIKNLNIFKLETTKKKNIISYKYNKTN